jgi:hypothetical protein
MSSIKHPIIVRGSSGAVARTKSSYVNGTADCKRLRDDGFAETGVDLPV